MQDVVDTLQQLLEQDDSNENDAGDWSALDFLAPVALPYTSLSWPRGHHESVSAIDPVHPDPPLSLPKLMSFLSPEAAAQTKELLVSDQTDDAISGLLLEILGYERIEEVSNLLRHRDAFKNAPYSDEVESNGVEQSHHPVQPYVPQAQLLFRSAEEEAAKRKALQESRKSAGKRSKVLDAPLRDLDELERRRQATLQAAASRDARAGLATMLTNGQPEGPEAIKYPHVFSSASSNQTLSAWGNRFALPEGTKREMNENYEEITIPTPAKVAMRSDERLIPISELDDIGKGSFPGYATLNRLQSIVYPVAYKTNENMLVCAPTGAGKTDVAMLTVLRVLSAYGTIKSVNGQPRVSTADFKVVYVAPMKALAAEVVRKLGKRLAWLGVHVRELTGDMQLTRKEISQTHIIVTTPEKWAVVTNKPGLSGSLASKVKLLIVDEVHLLHDERGAVIELLVARTLRQVESSQSLIRIVGLSATLPNYLDVADFLGVNRYVGLFFFDSSFRPVPLEQHFIGCKGKPGSTQSRANLDEACFDKVSALVQEGHQVMVFVHARKETVKTAMKLKERATLDGLSEMFDPTAHPKYEALKRDMNASRNREMKELFANGFGIHHAGMLRGDRTFSERAFEQGISKVLVCTATLAWGVNLPAYAVLIKGTQLYDPTKGAFVDLSILDVLQIFGRAGRPQYETHGVGYIATTSDKVDHYVNAITQQHPIESKFVSGLVDALNSEIALGTISSIDEGVRWIGYTFLFVRMRRNPMVYGLTIQDVQNDPSLGQERHKLMTHTARTLASYGMANFDQDTLSLSPTELGTIAAKFFLRAQTIEIFNGLFKPKMTEADVLALLSKAKEFEQVAVREEENKELELLMKKIPCQVLGGSSTNYGKVNILLQGYISKLPLEDFALISDQGYVAQNAGRICRALFEIALSKKWSETARVVLSLCKSIERRLWSFDHPLLQTALSGDMKYAISEYADEWSHEDIVAATTSQVADLLHTNDKNATAVKDAAASIPSFHIDATLQTLTDTMLRITVVLRKTFDHSSKMPASLFFWLWVAGGDDVHILQLEQLSIHSSQKEFRRVFEIDRSDLGDLLIRLESDNWLTSEQVVEAHISMRQPDVAPGFTRLLQIPLLHAEQVLATAGYQPHPAQGAVFDTFMSQTCHSILLSQANALLCASSEQTRLEFGLYTLIAASQRKKDRILVLAPDLASARNLIRVLTRNTSLNVHFAASTADLANPAQIMVAPPSVLWQHMATRASKAARIALVLCLDLHLLSHTYELALTQLRDTVDRIVGISFPLQDAVSMAEWLHCPPAHVYNFDPNQRSVPLQISFQSFTSAASVLSASLLPAHTAIKSDLPSRILCVLPSKSQLSEVAAFFTRQLQVGDDVGSGLFVGDPALLENYVLLQAHNPDVRQFLESGIALLAENARPGDRQTLLRCFRSGASKLLVTTASALAHLPSISADLVLVLGCTNTFVDQKGARITESFGPTDILSLLSHSTKRFLAFCSERERDTYTRLLSQGQTLESRILQEPEELYLVLLRRIAASLASEDDLLQLLQPTYLGSRVERNPCFYLPSSSDDSVQDLSRVLDQCLDRLKRACLVKRDAKWGLTKIGRSVVDGELSLEALLGWQDGRNGGSLAKLDQTLPGDVLWQFYSRFPRSLKDTIIVDKTNVADHAGAVLWAGFKEGRFPPQEELQAALLQLLKIKSADA